jgi:hypothetical protein
MHNGFRAFSFFSFFSPLFLCICSDSCSVLHCGDPSALGMPAGLQDAQGFHLDAEDDQPRAGLRTALRDVLCSLHSLHAWSGMLPLCLFVFVNVCLFVCMYVCLFVCCCRCFCDCAIILMLLAIRHWYLGPEGRVVGHVYPLVPSHLHIRRGEKVFGAEISGVLLLSPHVLLGDVEFCKFSVRYLDINWPK